MNGGWVSNGYDDFAFFVGVLWWPACLCGCGHGCSLFSLVDVAQGQRMGSMRAIQFRIDQLTLDEIAWWRDLYPHRLIMILRSEAGQ